MKKRKELFLDDPASVMEFKIGDILEIINIYKGNYQTRSVEVVIAYSDAPDGDWWLNTSNRNYRKGYVPQYGDVKNYRFKKIGKVGNVILFKKKAYERTSRTSDSWEESNDSWLG